MRGWLLALLLVAPVLSGCIGDDSEDATDTPDGFPVAWSEKALAFGDGHDHEDRAQHRGLSTGNFDVLGHDPLNSPYHGDQPAGAYFCGDAAPVDGDRRLAVVESRTDVGFAIADVTDPGEPRWLGELVMQTTHVYDLAVAPDGEHVVLVTSEVRDEGQPAAGGLLDAGSDGEGQRGLVWHTPCAQDPVPVTSTDEEDPVPRPMSILLVDISDPGQPTIVEQQPLMGSGHSVYTTRLDGRDWVMVTTTRVPGPVGVPVIPENSISAYEFYALTSGEAGPQLELLSTWKRMPDEASNRPLGPRGHDGWLAKHPETDTTLAYLVGGDRFTILDMSEPRNPAELGRWTVKGPGTPEGEGTLHSAYPLPELWDGKHYTLIGPEHAGHPEDHPSGIIWVMDTTDPSDIRPVAGWTLPHEVQWDGTFMFSNHYLTVVGTTAFVSMYHGGIWAVDLSPLVDGAPTSFLDLESIGVYLPDRDPPQPAAQPERWAPTVEEVLSMPDGTLVTFDGNSGLYTLSFDESDPAPSPEPWTITAETS